MLYIGGSKCCGELSLCFSNYTFSSSITIVPPMKKAMEVGGAKAMTKKGAILKAIATEHGLKTKACSAVLNSLVSASTKEIKKNVFIVPGLCRLKTRRKPGTKADVKVCVGKEVVKALCSWSLHLRCVVVVVIGCKRTAIKSFLVLALKDRL